MSTFIFIALFIILVLALGGGLLFFLRRQAAGKKEAKKAAPRKTASKPASENHKTQPPDPVTAEPIPGTALSETAPSTPLNATTPLYQPESGEKIRILIVDDNPDTRDHVSRLLYFEKDMEVIGQAVNGRHGIEMAVEHKPHIVLMDINMPDMDGIAATKEMSVKVPFSQVVVMSVQAEHYYIRQAMSAGARDFQPKPFTSEELVSCLRRVYTISQPVYQKLNSIEQTETQVAAQKPRPETEKRSGEAGDTPVIAVYSPKGGLGTSTLATNLAIALQRTYGDVVLMDADWQFGDILVHLNIRPTRTVNDLIHEGELDLELLPEVLLPHNSGLKLLLAPPQPEYGDAITALMVSRIVKSLRNNCKAVVIDTNSKLDDRTLTVLEQANYILMLTAPELPAIKSAKLFLEMAELLEFHDRLGVVINQVNQPGGLPPAKIEKVLKLKQAYYIPHDPRISLTINRGVPVTQQEPNTPSAQAFAHLASEIWQRLNNKDQPAHAPAEVAA